MRKFKSFEQTFMDTPQRVAKLTTQIIYKTQQRKVKYGMVTACIGFGQGIAGVFEIL